MRCATLLLAAVALASCRHPSDGATASVPSRAPCTGPLVAGLVETNGTCAFQRIDAGSGAHQTLVSIPGGCVRPDFLWNEEGTKIVIASSPSLTQQRLWVYDTRTGVLDSLGRPPAGTLMKFGWTEDGALFGVADLGRSHPADDRGFEHLRRKAGLPPGCIEGGWALYESRASGWTTSRVIPESCVAFASALGPWQLTPRSHSVRIWGEPAEMLAPMEHVATGEGAVVVETGEHGSVQSVRWPDGSLVAGLPSSRDAQVLRREAFGEIEDLLFASNESGDAWLVSFTPHRVLHLNLIEPGFWPTRRCQDPLPVSDR